MNYNICLYVLMFCNNFLFIIYYFRIIFNASNSFESFFFTSNTLPNDPYPSNFINLKSLIVNLELI